MIESLVVVAGVVLLAGLGLAVPLLPPEWWIWGGFSCAGLGLLVGVPTGFWYHVRLRQALLLRGTLPVRWWLRPVALHPQLREDELGPVLLWFYVGGAGFLVTMVGCGGVVLGVVLQAHRAGLL